jgi:hypothetical protein
MTGLLAGCTATDGAAPEEESEASEAQPIINGQSASAYTEAALVNGPGYICSGAIIAPRVALTAGHCVHASSFSIKAPYANKSSRASRKWTEYVNTGETVNPNTKDVAVIILDTAINLPWYPPLAKEPVASGTKAINVGRIKNGAASSSALFFGKEVALYPSSYFPFSYYSELVIQSGDSGGPVYTGTGLSRQIVAVNSGAGSNQILARVDLVYDKIRTLIEQNGGFGGTTTSPSEPPAPGDCASSEAEPNDESSSPNALGTKTCGSLGSGADVDWYSWEIGAANVPYEVSLTTTGDADIVMWKNSGAGWKQITNTSPTRFAASSSGAGKYVVAVRSSGNATQSYTLSLQK